MIYELVTLSKRSNDPKPRIQGTPLFDVEYLGNYTRYGHL